MTSTKTMTTLTESLSVDATASFNKSFYGNANAPLSPGTLFADNNLTNTNQRGMGSTSENYQAKRTRFFPHVEKIPPIRETFQAMQKWEGHVIEVGPDTFWARLVRILGEGPDQEAEIFIEEIDRDDRSLIEPGAVFYWSIGYFDRPSGRQRTSVLRFRRLPSWTTQDLMRANAEAERLEGLFDAE
jgi:hypothetical protein